MRKLIDMKLYLLALLAGISIITTTSFALPTGFVYLEEVDASIIQDIKFATSKNIVGRPLPGYKKPRCILTKKTALALAEAQKRFKIMGYSLKIFQGYQPKQSGVALQAWTRNIKDTKAWAQYYPKLDKVDVLSHQFRQWKPDAYSRGSTVALGLVEISPSGKAPMNMDLGYHENDFSLDMGPATEERRLCFSRYVTLVVLGMSGVNFKFNYESSFPWLAFTLRGEPFPNTYFEFPVE